MTIQTLIQNFIQRPRTLQKQVVLCPRQTVRLGARPMRITCLSGLVWITRAGSLDDILLEPGDTFNNTPRGLVVAQAISEARVEISQGLGNSR
jgi:hypothetical protein